MMTQGLSLLSWAFLYLHSIHLKPSLGPDCLWLPWGLNILKPCSGVGEKTGTHIPASLPAGPPYTRSHEPLQAASVTQSWTLWILVTLPSLFLST